MIGQQWSRAVAPVGAAACALVACNPGSESGPPAPGLEAGDTVALLAFEIPFADEVLLRGTVPVPPGTWSGDGDLPLAVLDHDDAVLPTQLEVVSRYPSAADGAAVVEVLARVPGGLDHVVGESVRYRVALVGHADVPDPGEAGVEDLIDGPLEVPDSVEDLLVMSQAFAIEATDVFGNIYTCNPTDGTGVKKLLRHGVAAAELKVSQVMTPFAAAGSEEEAPLPHFLGVNAYLSTLSGEELVILDLRFHNGHSGNDKTTDLDDPLGKIYFRSVNIWLPEGWVVVQDFVDPFLDYPVSGEGFVLNPLVKPNPDGSMHVMTWLGQFNRRLAIARAENWERAQKILRGAGLGVAQRGFDPDQGREYWSWWNAETARWFPQSHVLPSLAHLGVDAIRQEIADDLEVVKMHLEDGTGLGSYPVTDEVLGWAHPYGVPYGGMAGGAEIHIVDGVRAVEIATPEGYQLFRILHRMQSDRMPNAFLDVDGEPTSVESWLVQPGDGRDYVPFEHFMVPIGSSDPFGLGDAPTHQVEYVEANGLQPPYENDLLSYNPHDYQHFIRYTRSAKVLAWLANDSLAKDDLRMQAENFNLSYHQHFNSEAGFTQSTGLRWDLDYVAEHPATGFPFGRGEGWGLDCMNAAYATADEEWRATKRPWFDVVAELLADGQASCSGFIQAQVTPAFFEGEYRGRQQIEQSILENAFLGLIETVYRGEDTARTSMLEEVLRRSLWSMISDMAWSEEKTGPWARTAVGPEDLTLPVWCSFSEMPADGHTDWTDEYQNWSSFAYGFELTGDPAFLDFAAQQAGGGDLLFALESAGTDNLFNKSALLALMQQLQGVP
ncbi:MAG: hypothetical protein O7B99_15655 [Planctomycetota bacterium]|nr:hypothetical protein [Planctomycetota bacterium]